VKARWQFCGVPRSLFRRYYQSSRS
jgi:hypothetical protein